MRIKRQARQKRRRPARLAEKLLHIRTQLDLSQGQMVKHLGVEDELDRDYISKYEREVLEPPLHVLLAYARSFGISTDLLIDDELDLPARPKPTRRK